MLWLLKVMPVYLASASALFFGKKFGRHPIDCGKCFIDGRRILGDGKTVEGFLSGFLVGGILGTPFVLLASLPAQLAFILSLSGVVGDLIGSFVKRRLGLPRGHPNIILDSEDLVLGAALTGLFSLWELLILIILTPILHRVANIAAYKLGIKEVAW